MNENKQCLQAMLSHITGLVCLMEYGDTKDMQKLVDMALNISAQISSIDDASNIIDDEKINEESEHRKEDVL